MITDADAAALIAEVLLGHSWEWPDSFDECGAYVNSQAAYADHLAAVLIASPRFRRVLRERVAPVGANRARRSRGG